MFYVGKCQTHQLCLVIAGQQLSFFLMSYSKTVQEVNFTPNHLYSRLPLKFLCPKILSLYNAMGKCLPHPLLKFVLDFHHWSPSKRKWEPELQIKQLIWSWSFIGWKWFRYEFR